ncbi:hypothetical protein RhiirA5_362119 [Rhizophagus irregularis]|jgi:hypothetical protein|uniref:Uncharacterized protein n=3 Tax=Rhizophagus irregularis TaxID=588596 RepID=A0A2I1DXV6_9GLOM|nr:hypothetical protein RhiirA5_362119 [Rhizophagus irregularis]PKY14713.1 hypothetical protein RhiirB3_400693 [Rhizophagus irregularis]UZO00830.1 hypothetical protein OCT59_011946 [Rhizophagus irregularis]GET64562.1 hypothetical protein GLOIN_2v1839297 [Rhizophagus irregularis DAOM 181602=DAOM 197198]
MLSDHLSDSTFLVKNEPSMDNNSTCQIKHRIKISKYGPITISAMLEYLYTNKVSRSMSFIERAKSRILNELTLNNND